MNLDIFYHDEIGQPLSEREPVIEDNEFIHQYLVKQGYFQVKYKFIEPFHLLVN